MTTTYRCRFCQQEYSPEEANRLGFACRGIALVRGNATDQDWSRGRARTPAPADGLGTGERLEVRRILPPPSNERDAAAVEQLLGSLHGQLGPLSLEIAGSARERQLLVRGTPATVAHVVHQLQAAYGQLAWDDPRDTDPALCLVASSGLQVAQCRMRLRRPAFFPLRTWREFDQADPLRVLLGAFRGLAGEERLLAQLVLHRPAPDDWADAYQGAAQQVDFRTRAASAAGQARTGLFALAIVLGTVDLVALCAAVSVFFRPTLGFLQALKAIAVMLAVVGTTTALAIPGWRAWQALTGRLNANPTVVQRKVSLPAFECELRLWAAAATRERADELMRRLTSAYSLFDLAEGNALLPILSREEPLPGLALPASPVRWCAKRDPAALIAWCRERLRRVWECRNGRPMLVLNQSELAALWHMPVGEALEMVRRQEYELYVPLPGDVADPEGVSIGVSVKDARTQVSVALSGDAVRRNVLLMGKTQMGKSNIMELLAHAAMARQGTSLVVLDPQGDMARHLAGLVPPDRIGEAYYVDFADRQRCVGLNLLDMSLGTDLDKVVSDLISLGEALWSEYWGPRMESVWRYATRSLGLINQHRVAQGHPERQYTLLDVPALLLTPKKERQTFLLANLPLDTPEGQDVLWWWSSWYEPLRSSLQQDVISPVLTKIFRLSGDSSSRAVFGQAVSTLDLRQVLRREGILLVHTATGELGEDIGGFLGAVILNMLNVVIRERAAETRAGRSPCQVIVDEFQAVPAVDYGALLSELQKFEVAFVLGTQSLARLRSIQRELPGIIFAGVTTLMSFQVNYEDAMYVSGELDGVLPESLVNLEPYHAYVKTTGADRKRLPVYSVATRPPLSPDPGVAARVLDRVSGYSRLIGDVQEQTMPLAREMRDGEQAQQRERDLAVRLQAGNLESFVSEQQLSELARLGATQSSQDYTPEAGKIGRGIPSRASRRTRRRQGGAGFRVAGEGDG